MKTVLQQNKDKKGLPEANPVMLLSSQPLMWHKSYNNQFDTSIETSGGRS